jgi:hypothetical protein
MIPTRILGDVRELAPLDLAPTAEGDDDAAEDAAEEDASLVAEAYDEELAPLLLSAEVISCGIIMGVLPAAPRSTDPSSLMTSEFAARKLRVYMTFCATYWCDQLGMAFMSMLPPQEEALLLPDIWLEYEAMAAISELFEVNDCIMPETELGEPIALGGLMIPNMPFGQ